MNDQSYRTTLLVDATPDQAFAAINDVRGWWSQDVDGRTDTVGAEFDYRGNQDGRNVHRARIRVVEQVPGERVVWQVLDNWMSFIDDQAEWTGTRIVFEISPDRARRRDPLQPRRAGAVVRVLRRVLRRLDLLHPVQPARAHHRGARRADGEASRALSRPRRPELRGRRSSASLATPAGTSPAGGPGRRPRGGVRQLRRHAGRVERDAVRPGLDVGLGAERRRGAQCRARSSPPSRRACRRSATGGHSRFFSASSSRVAST